MEQSEQKRTEEEWREEERKRTILEAGRQHGSSPGRHHSGPHRAVAAVVTHEYIWKEPDHKDK